MERRKPKEENPEEVVLITRNLTGEKAQPNTYSAIPLVQVH